MFDGTTCQAFAFVNVKGTSAAEIATAAAAAALAYAAYLASVQLPSSSTSSSSCSCPVLAIQAVLLTFSAMGTGGGAKPTATPTPPASVPPTSGGMKLRWRFSALGIGAGVFGGLAALVYLQQAGMVYPTLNVTIASLVIGLLVGIGLPTLTRSMWGGRVKKAKAAK